MQYNGINDMKLDPHKGPQNFGQEQLQLPEDEQSGMK